jgi:lipopolysaccharide/colanic/teichoic acid biosynthesis glycosyltransferase
MIKRLFDFFFSLLGILILIPVFGVISCWIVFDSSGGVFYRQVRVGLGGKDFRLLKFRTMRTGAEKQGLLTVGGWDKRITRSGYYLRKYKLDELPQLFNVLIGDMSLVGPRPEVRKYVDMYTPEQRQVLDVRPGITDYASIAYSNENELLAASENPEDTYIREIMPAKLQLNRKYIEEKGAGKDLRIIFKTLLKIMS